MANGCATAEGCPTRSRRAARSTSSRRFRAVESPQRGGWTMAGRLWVATRKGLFTLERDRGRWAIGRASFLGDHVSMVLPDGRDGSVYAALDHGHFGVKLHRSRDGGETWQEIA